MENVIATAESAAEHHKRNSSPRNEKAPAAIQINIE